MGRRGFTLVELLVVTAIIAVVVAAVGACLASGIRVWEVAHRFGEDEMTALTGIELVARDLANALPLRGVEFVGEPGSLAFAAESDALPGGPGLCEVRYVYDAQAGELKRAVTRFPGDKAEGAQRWESVCSGLAGGGFRYRVQRGAEKSSVEWTDNFRSVTNTPVAVEVSMAVGRDAEAALRVSRMIKLRMR